MDEMTDHHTSSSQEQSKSQSPAEHPEQRVMPPCNVKQAIAKRSSMMRTTRSQSDKKVDDDPVDQHQEDLKPSSSAHLGSQIATEPSQRDHANHAQARERSDLESHASSTARAFQHITETRSDIIQERNPIYTQQRNAHNNRTPLPEVSGNAIRQTSPPDVGHVHPMYVKPFRYSVNSVPDMRKRLRETQMDVDDDDDEVEEVEEKVERNPKSPRLSLRGQAMINAAVESVREEDRRRSCGK